MKVSVAIVTLMLFIQGATSAQTTLFPFGSTWKYKVGNNQDTEWKSTAFDDTGWSSGSGELGYGDGGESTVLPACPNNPCNSGNRYISYFFRKTINISDVSVYPNFKLEMFRDDGVVIYVNGTEVYRNNMPGGTINFNTLATDAISGSDETTILTTTITLAASNFSNGDNTIAVEVHQSDANSSDFSWDMQLTGVPFGFTTLTVGPYLQKATATSILVRWYTATPVDSKVSYGTSPGNLSQSETVGGSTTDHSVTLTGLTPYTTYYYSIETSTTVLQSGVDNYFLTSPLPNTQGKYSFWVIGDMGNNSTNQRNVRDSYLAHMGTKATNGWLLLGDNAYTNGTEAVYNTNFFDIYENNIMRKSPLWPATGNHEYENSLARQRDHNVAYFDFFDPPTQGEAGGVASNMEAYYSYDYGNIHFIALDSYIIETVGSTEYRLFNTAGPQVQWLIQDLQANTKQWTVVYFHHPPYSMGSHNSDTETQMRLIRENVVVPILEQYDVDLVLTGHSHSYERSKLMKGHNGLESTFSAATHHLSQSSGKYDGSLNSCPYIKDDPNPDWGTVYAVVGSSGMLETGESTFPHNAMYYGNDNIGGSMILEVEGNRLDAKWLASNGTIMDQFTMMKDVNNVSTINVNAGESVTLTASWVGQYNWSSGQTSRSITVTPASSGTYTVTDPNLCLTDTYNITVNSLADINIPSVGFTEICAGSTVNISYTISGTFTAGNTFTLQLSNASGSFSSSVNIGSLSGTTSGTINGLIPANTTSGSNYRLRVVSSSPVVTGGQSAVFSINALPTSPVVGTITQPTCSVATGSVVLSGLPSSGTWTLTRSPGGATTTGTGTSTTISGLAINTYTYTVTSASGCVSTATLNIVINAQPTIPTAPIVGAITQPTCSVATGSVALSGLPSSGTWTLTRSPGGATSAGTGTTTTITGLPTGTYTFTVTNAATCISPPTSNVVIDVQPATPPAPVVGTITQPTCSVATGSVVLSGLPSSGTWTLTRTPGGITTTGTGASSTISGLVGGTYTYTVADESTCVSLSSANIVINAQPITPTAPVVGTITQPTCGVATGSVVLSGLPSSGTWTLTRTPGGTTTTGTGTSTTISGLTTDTYTFTVTNASTCVSPSSSNVVIDTQPPTPTAPVVGMITQPTCSVATGSVVLSGLPSSGTWTLTRSPGGIATTGTGTSTTISGLPAGTYAYTVADESTCNSNSSSNIVINTQPITPTAPVVGTITQPTCSESTGSVLLNGLPSSGTWTLTRSPGGVTTTGTGTSTTISGLAADSYTYTVTNASTCISLSSANIVINAQPPTPTAPVVGSITQPTCSVATGSVVLSGLPSSGPWTLTRSPGGVTTTGTGTSANISGLSANTYTFTITNASSCISSSSSNVVIDTQPATPTAPVVGIITQPTCSVATGSVVLSSLPSSGTWILTRSPGGTTTTGTGTSTTIAGLVAGTYTYTVVDESNCISLSSVNIVINTQPITPTAPIVGTITQPTCSVATGSVVLSGLPSSGIWTLTKSPGGTTTNGTGTSTTISGLGADTYTYTVTNASACVSLSSANIVINAQPITPTAPVVGTITQPTCAVPTGSVALSGLPAGGWTINPGAITGSGATTTINGLAPAATYNFTVTETATGCTSVASANVVINAVPTTTAPIVGTITQPTCAVPTGSVALSGLPAGAWTINPGAIAGSGATTTLTSLTPATTFNFNVTETATGCISVASANVVINAVPASPSAPTATVTTHPTCSIPTGTITITVPASGAGVSYTVTGTTPVVAAQNNSTGIFSGLAAGEYDVTTSVNGCTSTSTALTVNVAPGAPAAPAIGTITQPTCAVPTGSVTLSGLPAGAWTINPGAIVGSGATTTLTLLTPATTFNFTVTETATGCTSVASANVVINAVPTTTTPIVGTITQPTCTVPTGSVAMSGLPAGAWTINPGAIAGSGPTTTLTSLTPATTFNLTVTETATGCTSVASANVVINAVPTTTAPIVGTINQPTCAVPTGSVALSGLPAGAWTINPGAIAGSGTTTTLTSLTPATTFNYTVTSTLTGCISVASTDVVINVVPTTTAPIVGTITQPTCAIPTGSVALSGLPAGGWTINPGAIAGSGATTTLTSLTPATTYNFTVTETATGCISIASANVVINAVPASPSAPTATVTTQPTCSIPSGIITVTDPANGVGISYTVIGTNPVVGPQTNSTGVFTGLIAGEYDVTTTVNGCTSATLSLTVNVAPGAPAAPTIDSITQPTCSEATGSVVLDGLPSSGTWTLTRSPGGTTTMGTGTSTTLSGLTADTYTYTVADASNCISPSSLDLVINAPPETPTAPIVSSITQPTCSIATGSVLLNGLPSSGAWTLTRNPGGITTTGTGTSTTISLLSAGTYMYTVTNAFTCISLSSSDVVIDVQPATPTAPTASVTTQPTCSIPSGMITVTAPANGVGISYTVTGTNPVVGPQTNSTGVFTGLIAGEYDVTTTVNGCTSATLALTVNVAPGAPAAPTIDSITQPTCSEATGSVALSGLPSSGTWTLTRSPGGTTTMGTGTSTTLSGLTGDTYTYTVTDASNCISPSSLNIVINAQPSTPVISDQTTSILTGETFIVTLSGVPFGTTYTWTSPTYTGDVTGGSAQTLPQSNISGSLTIPSGTGTATYTVTPTSGICIGSVFTVTVTVIYDPLPVEFVNFTATVDDEKVTLNWKTASELNNDYFEVQRFINQEKINMIGRIIGHGTTNETNEYEFVDVWPVNGIAYYRLKQVDFDGQYEYSNILRVVYDGSRSLKLYPNPGDGTMLNLALGMDEGFLQISVLDATGRNISKSFTHTVSDSNVLEVLFESKLAPGMYFIHVKSNAGITSRKWIVK